MISVWRVCNTMYSTIDGVGRNFYFPLQELLESASLVDIIDTFEPTVLGSRIIQLYMRQGMQAGGIWVLSHCLSVVLFHYLSLVDALLVAGRSGAAVGSSHLITNCSNYLSETDKDVPIAWLHDGYGPGL